MNQPAEPRTSAIVEQLAHIFAANGKQCYLVGGAVRDRLLGRENYDIDMATDALPAETKALASQANPDSLYTVGEKFGTVGLIFGGHQIEITTFRSEEYVPQSRKPAVTFGTSLQGDLSRRDFTINAIAYDVEHSQLIDPFGGTADIKARVIRAVGDPNQRFDEDPLRLLRAVRFAAQLNFKIEKATAQAITACRERLCTVSQERIGQEMNKILLSDYPAHGLRLLVRYGLAEMVLPELMPMVGLDQGEYHHKDVFEHTMGVLENTPPDQVLRWAALLHDLGKPATRAMHDGKLHFYGHDILSADIAREVLARMRLDTHTAERVTKLARMHMRANLYEPDWTDGAVRRLIREAGDEFNDLLVLSRADITSFRPRKIEAGLARVDELDERARYLLESENVQQLASPLDGNDLMNLFNRPPGPWIRDVKDYLLAKVLDGELAPDDKATAEQLALDFVDQQGS